MDIAQHQVVRFRLLPTGTGTDLALGPGAAIPEPATGSITGMAVLGVLNSAIAAYYYLRVIVTMYMQEPDASMEIEEAPLPRVAVAIPAALTILFGVLPGLLFGLLRTASVIRF